MIKHCNTVYIFYVLLIVHLISIFVNNQLDAHFFLICVYSNSLHVSSNQVLIIRRVNCINKTSGTHSMSLYVGGRVVCIPAYHTATYIH